MNTNGEASGRGPHPGDRALFGARHHARLREAVADLSWLRTRGYRGPSALKLVGDRHRLTERQRTAVGRCACSDQQVASRLEREEHPESVRGNRVLIDGFNVLTTVEAALAGGILLRGRDGCVRDMSSMHGNYRVLAHTQVAVEAILATLAGLEPGGVVVYLDRPVSNSGRLGGLIRELAGGHPSIGPSVRLVKDPDAILRRAGRRGVVATADSGILDACGRWLNLSRLVVGRIGLAPGVIDLAPS